MAKSKSIKQSSGYQALMSEIRAGHIKPLYVLFGEETFLIDKIVNSLSRILVTEGSESCDRVLLDAGGQTSRIDPERLKAEILTPPFLSGKKLVIVKNSGWLASAGSRGDSLKQPGPVRDTADDQPESGMPVTLSAQKARQDDLVKIFGMLPDSTCLVMIEQKVDRRLKQVINMIEAKGVLAELGREHPRVLRQWVESECRRRNLSIAVIAAESLIDRCDGSMRVIWQEMAKLFLYCEYAGCNQIDPELIEELSLPDLRGNIFDLTDALSEGNSGRALQLVDTLINHKEPVQLIQFMIARHLRQLICAAELCSPERITAELKVMPFVADRLARQARRLPVTVLEDLYSRCAEADMHVKTGRINDRLALETFLAEAAGQIKAAGRR